MGKVYEFEERVGDFEEALRSVFEGMQAGLWTALPCEIVSFDAARQTATLQPAYYVRVPRQDGSFEDREMPLLEDVPVYFPRGGDFALTFPVVAGDEALVVFSSRCIDGWWQNSGVQKAPEFRMHNLSDGFAFVGFTSQPKKLSGVSTSNVELRDADGTTKVVLTPAGNAQVLAAGDVQVEAGGDVNVVALGAVTVAAATTVDVVAVAGVNLTTPVTAATGTVTAALGFGMASSSW